MLATAQRLRRRGEFAATVRAGRRVTRGALVVHLVLPAEERTEAAAPTEPAQAGFIVPKAVGGAVLRNKVKRRLRHLVRDPLGALPPGTDLVVRALPGAAERGYPQLAADLAAALAAAARKVPR